MRVPGLVRELARHAPPGQVVRFLIVGAWNTLFGYAVYSLLTYLLIPRVGNDKAAAVMASLLGSVINITMSFFCHKVYVFRTKGNLLREYLRAYVVYGTTMLVSTALLPLVMVLLDLVNTPKRSVPYLAGAILLAGNVFISFFGHKRYTFQQPPAVAAEMTTGSQSEIPRQGRESIAHTTTDPSRSE